MVLVTNIKYFPQFSGHQSSIYSFKFHSNATSLAKTSVQAASLLPPPCSHCELFSHLIVLTRWLHNACKLIQRARQWTLCEQGICFMSRYYPQSQQSVQLAVTPPLVSSALTVAKLLLLFYFLFLLFMLLPWGGQRVGWRKKW